MPKPKQVKRRLTASLKHERAFQKAGCQVIFGIDEAGRGPLAGPVAAAAVALPLRHMDLSKRLAGVRDSKELSAQQRDAMARKIKQTALGWGIGCATVAEINELGIVPATKLAMQRALATALEDKDLRPDCLFLDYMLWPERRDLPQVSMVEGDKHSLSIACASILAKVWRDAYMTGLHAKYSHYRFDQNKGYGTEAHLSALAQYGPCEVHRRNFKPVCDLMVKQES